MKVWQGQIGVRRVMNTNNAIMPTLESAMVREFKRLTGVDSDFVFVQHIGELTPTQQIIERTQGPITSFDLKIGVRGFAEVPDGGDYPMRQALQAAFKTVTGEWGDFLYSGWNASLTENELKQLESQ